MADKSMAGREFVSHVKWEVERCKFKELVQAIGDDNPIFFEKEAALKEGYKNTPAPPTYLTVPSMWGGGMVPLIVELKINFAMVLHGGEEYEYIKEIYPGDLLTTRSKVVSIKEKESKSLGRKMDIIEILTEYSNQNNELVAKATSTIIERK